MKFSTQPQKNKGFTIIETLVAIAIMMIAIVGPLTIADKALTSAIYAHDQVTGSYLAMDAMEYLKNARDDYLMTNNVTPGSSAWLSSMGYSNNSCTVTYPCTVDTLRGDPTGENGSSNEIWACNPGSADPAIACVLYLSAAGYGLQFTSGGAVTKFARWFYITPNSNPDEAKVTVIVSWMTGTVPNQVILENEMFNVIK